MDSKDDKPEMTVLVSIRDAYVRDGQLYTGNNLDNPHHEDEDNKWRDVAGSVVVSIREADSIEAAITEVAKFYGCSVEIFEGYQIAVANARNININGVDTSKIPDKCHNCNHAWSHKDEPYEIDGRLYCGNCFVYCDKCSEPYPVDVEFFMVSGDSIGKSGDFRECWICPDCVPKEFRAFKPFTTQAMVNSLQGLAEVTILHENNNNDVVAEYNGIRCTAVFNPFVARYYVDDKGGVLSNPNKCPICGDYIA